MQAAVKGFLRYLRIERNASPLTLKSYGTDLAGLLEFLRSTEGRLLEPRDVTITLLRGYVAGLHHRGYARATIARRLASLRSLFEYCRREKLVESNPAKALRTPRQGRRLPHFLSTDQVAKLLETPSNDQPAGLRDRAILETLYSAGLRVSELVALNLGDWDRDANVLTVRGKGRTLRRRGARRLARGPQARRRHRPRRSRRRVPEPLRPTPECPQRRTPARKTHRRSRPRSTHLPPYSQTQLRQPHARRRSRPPQRPGTARPQEPDDDADLHPRQSPPAQRNLREGSPARPRQAELTHARGQTPPTTGFAPPVALPLLRVATSAG